MKPWPGAACNKTTVRESKPPPGRHLEFRQKSHFMQNLRLFVRHLSDWHFCWIYRKSNPAITIWINSVR